MDTDVGQLSLIHAEKADKQWTAIFPAEQKIEEDCLLFLSRMAYIAFAEYLLHREIVSPKIFKRRRINDIIFHTFNKDLRWGSKLSDMMRGIGEAIKMKYARQAFVMINEDENDQDVATEVFTITFAYNEEDCLKITDENGNSIISMGYRGKEAFRRQVGYLIQKITTISSALDKFQNCVTPFIKLTYYDDRTPTDYEPFAFKSCETTYIFKSSLPKFDFGTLTTNYGSSLIDIQSVYIKDVSDLESIVPQELQHYEKDYLNETVEGDVTILDDPSNMETDDVHQSESLEIAREENNELIESGLNQTYDVTNTEPILQEEFNNSCNDTTNDDDEFIPVHSQNSSKKKIIEKIQKSPLKRLKRGRKAKDIQDEIRNEDLLLLPLQAKVSRAHTSPNRSLESPKSRSAGSRCIFKSSVVQRCVEKSPNDMFN